MTPPGELSRWLLAFGLTLAIEVPIASVLLRREEPSVDRLVATCAFANLATHPLVWFATPLLMLSGWGGMAVSECFAWLAEAAFFAVVLEGLGLLRATAVSLLANAVSFGAGLVLYKLFGISF